MGSTDAALTASTATLLRSPTLIGQPDPPVKIGEPIAVRFYLSVAL